MPAGSVNPARQRFYPAAGFGNGLQVAVEQLRFKAAPSGLALLRRLRMPP